MGWEWGQLQLIRELADRGSVTAVAAATHRTPSAVSQQLKAIQRQAGIPLVEHVGRGLRLTDAGRALAASAGGVATALAEADATWDAFLGRTAGTVRLASFFSAGELLVPGLVERLSAYPELTVETFDEDVATADFAALVVDYDLVVAHRPDDTEPATDTGVRVTPLLREPLDVAVALDHRLAGREQVEPAELVGEAWIAPPPEFPIEQAVRALAARAGAPARIVRRTTHLPLMEGLVARGQGIALLPRYSTQEHASGRFVLVPVTGIRAGRLIEVLSRPERAARRAVRVVLAALQDEAHRIARGGAPG
ncbi:LysR family transcriptional regulator [Microlunatus aurantiacus]|uniref:LysR family transcriptional regulator n=1 Tax=Microlunatus aurantiacus TaxID=446786 RepID=A0ABP7DLR5_9ACTN